MYGGLTKGDKVKGGTRLGDAWVLEGIGKQGQQGLIWEEKDIRLAPGSAGNLTNVGTAASGRGGLPLPPRSCHTAVYAGESVWVFGGYGGGGSARSFLGDLYEISVETWEVCMCVCVCMYVCMYVCVCMYVLVSICGRMFLCGNVGLCMSVCKCLCAYVGCILYIYTYVYIYIYIYTYIHTYIDT